MTCRITCACTQIFATLPETADRLQRAEDMIAKGRGEEIVCRADHMVGCSAALLSSASAAKHAA